MGGHPLGAAFGVDNSPGTRLIEGYETTTELGQTELRGVQLSAYRSVAVSDRTPDSDPQRHTS
jgi:hypothetical protein